MNMDVIIACADLAGRAGATGFEMGYLHDDVPVEQAAWWAQATYRGARITAENHSSPHAAALALADMLLKDGMCKCGRPVALADGVSGCRWQLNGQRWEPSCTAPALSYDGQRGDLGALHAAAERLVDGNRAARRRRRNRTRE